MQSNATAVHIRKAIAFVGYAALGPFCASLYRLPVLTR